MFIGGKVHFMVENRPSSQIENFITYLLIFHNFRSLASFSHHFWIMQWILQPLITNGIITINKIKKAVCTQTPCRIYGKLMICLFVCLCGPQKLQIWIVTPSDGLSLNWDSTSSPRTILLIFFTTLMLVGRGMEEGKYSA